LHVQVAGPPVAVEPSGQAAQEKAVGGPVWKKLLRHEQYCEAGDGAMAFALMVEQAVHTESPEAETAEYVLTGQAVQLAGPLRSHEPSDCRAKVCDEGPW